MTRPFRYCLACLILIVSPLPWLFFFRVAQDEPFNGFVAWDAICYLGFGSALLVVLLELAGLIIFGMSTRRLSGWWSAALLWLAILAFLSFASASDWVGDLSRSPVWRSAEASPRAAADSSHHWWFVLQSGSLEQVGPLSKGVRRPGDDRVAAVW